MSTKSNTSLTYPCIVNITKAMGAKRKEPVIRALEYNTDTDLSKAIVYPTLRNAYVAGFDLIKETIDSKWQRISKQDAQVALQSLKDTGKLPEKPEKPAKVKPVKAAKTTKAVKSANKTPKTPPTAKVKAVKTAEAQEVPAVDQVALEDAE